MPRIKTQTREEILARAEATAAELFSRKGYTATTTREIARAAGYTAGALYAHYPSKEALFAATVERYRAQMHADDNPLVRFLEASRFPDDIEDMAEVIGELIRANQSYWRLWYVDVIEFDGAHFQSALAPAALLRSPGLQGRLDDLRQTGALRVDPEAAFVAVYMHLFNYFLVEIIFGGQGHYGANHREAARTIADMFLHGIKKES